MRLRAWLPFLAVVAVPVILASILLAKMQGWAIAADLIAAIREMAREWWAVPLFLILYALFALLLIPVGVLSAAAALAWGWEIGGTLELIACTIAALPPFAIARRGLPERVLAYLERHGFEARPEFFPLLILRVVPVVPYVALNYIAGVARFRTRDYMLATFFGSIPSVFLFAFFIDALGASAAGTATQLQILGACAAIAGLLIIGRFATRAVRRRAAAGPRSASTERPPERS